MLVRSKVSLARAIGCCSVLVTIVFVGGDVTMPARKQTKQICTTKNEFSFARMQCLGIVGQRVCVFIGLGNNNSSNNELSDNNCNNKQQTKGGPRCLL